MTHIEVVREKDALNQERWQFLYIDGRHALVMIQYLKQERETTRHKFKAIEAWDAYKDRRREYDRDVVELDNFPSPEDVRAEAKQKFMDSLEIQIGFPR